jgi:hypothetical protein
MARITRNDPVSCLARTHVQSSMTSHVVSHLGANIATCGPGGTVDRMKRLVSSVTW